MQNQKAVPPHQVVTKNFLDAKQRRARFPGIFKSSATECRMRQRSIANVRGDVLRWYPIPGSSGFLVEENEVLAWIEGNAIKSSAELPDSHHGNKFKHLAAAREKANAALRRKSN